MRNRTFPLVFLSLFSLLLLSGVVNAQKQKGRQKRILGTVTVTATKPTAAKRRQETFFLAWSTLNDNYFDKTFGGLDWNKIRNEYRPRVDRARSDSEFHRILEEMMNRLGKSHLNLIVPEYFEKIETAKIRARAREKELAAERERSSGKTPIDNEDDAADPFSDPAGKKYGIGIEVRILDGQLVVTRVEQLSGAKVSGIKPGYVIEKINGVTFKEITSQLVLAGVSLERIKDLLPIGIEEDFLNGDPETSVFITCRDENDQVREFTVPRLALDGSTVTLSKHLPEQRLVFESRSLSPDIGYIRFNSFAIPVVGKFCDSITEFRGKKAIVVDLRGHLGGLLAPMIGLAGMLTEKPLTLGTFYNRTSEQKFTVSSKGNNFKGRIVLLVDGQSLSASEMFASGLRSNGRVLIVGEQTGGQSLPAVWTKLPTGAVMMYPISDFHPLGGRSLEGVGVRPDHLVGLDRRSLLTGIDAQLQKAIAVAGDDSAFAKQPPSTPRKEDSNGPPLVVPDYVGPATPPPPPAKLDLSKLPPPPKVVSSSPPTPTGNDERAVKIISDFASAFGGRDAAKQLTSYEVRGKMIESDKTELDGDFYSAWEAPNKIAVVLNTPSVGEVRSVFNGKNSFQETDFGVSGEGIQLADRDNADFFAPYFRGMDLEYLKGLKYEGDWAVAGRSRHALSAVNPRGEAIGLSFYADSKMLASFSVHGTLFTFDDFRKVDGVMVPFRVEISRLMDVRLESVKLNSKIDPSAFEKKEKCFDKVN